MSFKFVKKLKVGLKNIVNDIKQLDSEVNDYKKVSKNPYLPSVAYVNWAIHLAEMGEFEEAEKKLISSASMAHQTPETYINLGLLKTKEGDFTAALDYYSKAIRLDNNNSRAYCFLANTLTELRDFKEAEKKFRYAEKLDPNNSEIYLNWGLSLMRQHNFITAREKFEYACKLNLSNFTALYFWGIVELELEETDRAKEKFNIILTAIPDHKDALYYLSYLNFKDGLHNESLELALKAIEVNPEKIELYMIIAENYMHLGNEQECFNYYQFGEENCKTNHHFLNSWGIALIKFERYEEANERLLKAIKLYPENESGLANLGLVNYKMGKYPEAIEYFEKSLAIHPRNILSLDNLGKIYFENKDYKKAIEYFGLILKYSAKATDNYLRIANSYYLLSEFTKANEYYKKATEYCPDDKYVYIDYARLLMSQKDYKQALTKIKKAYKMDESNLDCLNILFNLHYTLAKENISDYNVREANKIAEKIEENYPNSFEHTEKIAELKSKLNSSL